MNRKEKRIIQNKEIMFFGTVKGLVSERKLLKDIVEEFNPELILVGISPEELEGLKNYLKKPFTIEADDYENIKAKKLEKYGEVGLPVPTYLEAFAISTKNNVDIIPVDIPDDEYVSLFTNKVSFFNLLSFNMRKRKIWKMDFKADSPEEFVLKWDKEVNRINAYREIEKNREEYMSRKIIESIEKREEKRILVIVELERYQGVLENLNLLHTT